MGFVGATGISSRIRMSLLDSPVGRLWFDADSRTAGRLSDAIEEASSLCHGVRRVTATCLDMARHCCSSQCVTGVPVIVLASRCAPAVPRPPIAMALGKPFEPIRHANKPAYPFHCCRSPFQLAPGGMWGRRRVSPRCHPAVWASAHSHSSANSGAGTGPYAYAYTQAGSCTCACTQAGSRTCACT